MKILVITNKDGPNLFIENIVKELVARGHELTIYAQFLDETSIRMFQTVAAPIYPLNKLTDKKVRSFDMVFCPVQSIGHTVFFDKYVFSYCNMNPAFDHVRGADFVFTLGELQEPYEQTFSYMPVGMPKNDTPIIEIQTDSRRILVLDSGHFPFAETGKKQVAGMILEMCQKFPSYEICVKPRWLPETEPSAMTHINGKHLYTFIDELCGFQRPENLNLLMEYLDLQELIDGSCCVVTLCTTAYLDVALRGKRLIVAKGFDNEDMYQVRKDYFDRVYAYAEGSGCVVDYHDVCRYLPEGITCRPEHLENTFAYAAGASARVVEVMEYIYVHYLEYDLYPAINAYSYEDYREKLSPDPSLTLSGLKRWRMYHITDSVIALNRSISPAIDWTSLIQLKKALCIRAAANKEGLKKLRGMVKKAKYRFLLEHADELQSNEIDRSFYFAALFYQKDYEELLALLDSEEGDRCALFYYCGQIFYGKKDYDQAANCLSQYLEGIRGRDYLKFFVETDFNKRPGILCLLECYHQQNNLDAMASLLDYYLNDPCFKLEKLRDQKYLHTLLVLTEKYCREKGELGQARLLLEKDNQLKQWARETFRKKIKQQFKEHGICGGFINLAKIAWKRICNRILPLCKKKKFALGKRLKYLKYRICGLVGWYDEAQRAVLERKNQYLGQACVVIGNGPSLRAEDLEALQAKGYTCFASNKIYKIFEHTSWRPDFYACTDGLVFKQNYREIFEAIECPIYLIQEFKKRCESNELSSLVIGKVIRYLKYYYWKNTIRFYPDCRIVVSGGSVTHVLISLAWMMGFRTIYLIGCDHNYGTFAGATVGKTIDPGTRINQDYFAENYMKPGEVINVGDLEKATEGYRVDREYIERHGGHLYNATRGGMLEVLERVNLDDLLKGSGEGKRENALDPEN